MHASCQNGMLQSCPAHMTLQDLQGSAWPTALQDTLKHKVLMKPRITSCVPHVLLARELIDREAHAVCRLPLGARLGTHHICCAVS